MASKPSKAAKSAETVEAVTTETTAAKQLRPFMFQPGQSGNPAGRPKGSRNRIGEDFLTDALEVWREHGKAALVSTATEEPAKFVQVIAGLLPKELNVTTTTVEQMSDDELFSQLDLIKGLIAGASGGPSGELQADTGRDRKAGRGKASREQLN